MAAKPTAEAMSLAEFKGREKEIAECFGKDIALEDLPSIVHQEQDLDFITTMKKMQRRKLFRAIKAAKPAYMAAKPAASKKRWGKGNRR